ncbi:piggyBac transposable element-derived protein 4-like [Vespula squamosa]|uniref:PiggyBac transposable element-derived protein 4-like n=1 Tax=Vespula squamosa TaxID=30214 RepID=A0ABD2BS69_VESSQ
MKPFTGRERIITTDNFFTSTLLAAKLLDKKITIVGTIHGNKRELSKFAKYAKDGMPYFSTEFYKSNYNTLTKLKAYNESNDKKVLPEIKISKMACVDFLYNHYMNKIVSVTY